MDGASHGFALWKLPKRVVRTCAEIMFNSLLLRGLLAPTAIWAVNQYVGWLEASFGSVKALN
jgi:hypothetical protein